jgi:hypothetical protein
MGASVPKKVVNGPTPDLIGSQENSMALIWTIKVISYYSLIHKNIASWTRCLT